MNSKPLAITFVIAITLGLLTWIRGDQYNCDIRTILPFLDGRETSIYTFGSLVLIGLGFWGIHRLYRNPQPDDDQDAAIDEPSEESPAPDPGPDDGGSDQGPT